MTVIRKLIGWAAILPLHLSNLALQVVGLVVVPVAALFTKRVGNFDVYHFPQWAWLWDNHHDRKSHGIDGRDIEREKIKNDWLRRVYWAGYRNRASNYGTMVLGYLDSTGETIEEHGSMPSDWNGQSGFYVGYAKVYGSWWLRPLLYFIKDYGNGKCFYLKFGWKVWEDDDPQGDTDEDYIGLAIDIHPWRKFGGRTTA